MTGMSAFPRRAPRSVCAIAAVACLLLLAGCSTRGERLYRRAEAFFAQGKYELAAAEYRRIVDEEARSPLAPDAEYKLAYVYREYYRNVQAAIGAYSDLAARYPSSAYADEAMFWVVWLQARRLKDPAAAATTCAEIDRLHPQDSRLRSRAALELARAQIAAGQFEAAARTTKHVIADFPDEQRAGAEAALLSAEIVSRQGGDAKQALNLYEQVIAKYPDSPAAAEAKRAIGWLYYGQKSEDAARQRQETQRRTTFIGRVGAFGGSDLTAPQRACEAFRALLGSRGVSAPLSEIMAVTGVAFLFPYSPQGTLPPPRNLFETAAAEYGFAHNAGGAESADEAYTILEQRLLHDQPVMVAYAAAESSWAIVVGCRAAESRLLVLLPGRQSPATVDKGTFLGRWAAVSGLWGLPSAARYFQFALGARSTKPTVATMLQSALRRGNDALQQGQVGGLPAGDQAWNDVSRELAACQHDPDPARRGRIANWVRGPMRVHETNAQAVSQFLARSAGQLPASGLAADAAETFAECAAQMTTLRAEVAAAGSDADAWGKAAARADGIAGLFRRATEQVKTAATRL